MDNRLATILTELRRRLRGIYGPRLARLVLFGSCARDNAEPGSDIDVLVVLYGPVAPGKEIARVGAVTAELSLKYNVVISCTFVSAERYSTEQSPLLLNVRREGITIFGQHFAKTGRVPSRYHRYLIEAQSSRNVGDYDVGPGLSEKEAASQIVRASEFLELAERLLGSAETSETEK